MYTINPVANKFSMKPYISLATKRILVPYHDPSRSLIRTQVIVDSRQQVHVRVSVSEFL
jgi:hypothetical protein